MKFACWWDGHTQYEMVDERPTFRCGRCGDRFGLGEVIRGGLRPSDWTVFLVLCGAAAVGISVVVRVIVPWILSLLP